MHFHVFKSRKIKSHLGRMLRKTGIRLLLLRVQKDYDSEEIIFKAMDNKLTGRI